MDKRASAVTLTSLQWSNRWGSTSYEWYLDWITISSISKHRLHLPTVCLVLTVPRKNNMIHKPLSKRESSCTADLDDFSFDSESEMIEFARSRNFVEIASDDRILNKNIAADDLLFQRTTDEQRIRDYCLVSNIRWISLNKHFLRLAEFLFN